MMNFNFRGGVASIAILTYASSVFSAGALDWADPCVDGGKTFTSNAAGARARVEQVIHEWDSRVEPPGELRSLYVEAVREGAYKTWSDDPTAKALIDALKAKDAAFNPKNFFFEKIYPKVITPEKEAEYVRSIYKVDYDGKIRPNLINSRSALEQKIANEKSKLDEACKPDVLSQLLRGTIGNALMILGSNWSAAQNESGDVAKYYRAVSGISVTDIQKYGLQGGPNSEMNKILGGENSVARQIISSLDPSKWQVSLPKIESPPAFKIGDFCIWC